MGKSPEQIAMDYIIQWIDPYGLHQPVTAEMREMWTELVTHVGYPRAYDLLDEATATLRLVTF